jgi:hypothetical protein
MGKTILIPTDFTVESLQLVKSFLSRSNSNESYDILLVHGVDLGDSITDLLFFSKNKHIELLSNKAFEDACDIIINKYDSQINSLRKDIFTGYTQSAFNNYVEANNVGEAFVPGNYKLNLRHKKSFDILPYIRKSNLKTEAIEWLLKETMPEKGKVAEVFYNSTSAN